MHAREQAGLAKHDLSVMACKELPLKQSAYLQDGAWQGTKFILFMIGQQKKGIITGFIVFTRHIVAAKRILLPLV